MKKKGNKGIYNYRFNVFQIDTTDGLQWCVEYPDISAVVGGGHTPEEAIAEAKNNLTAYIDYLKEEGKELPAPSKYENEFSGKFTLRMSYNLHKRVTELSELEGISINSYINEALVEKTRDDINRKSLEHIISRNSSKLKNVMFPSLSVLGKHETNGMDNELINNQIYHVNKKRITIYSVGGRYE